MKVSPKTTAGNRVSALKRLSKPAASSTGIQQRLGTTVAPVVTDARQLLSSRSKPAFDARQLLSRQSSTTQQSAVESSKPTSLFITRSTGGRVSATSSTRNSQLTEPISFTKTIKNTSVTRAPPQPAASDQKVVISFVNDQYRKRPKSPLSPPPIIRRLNDAPSASSSTSRAPIRTSVVRRDSDDEYEPPVKRTTARNTPPALPSSSKSPLKRTATEAFATARPKTIPSSRSDSTGTAVLITNLQPTVTDEDVIELFSKVGSISDFKTWSPGCLEIVYATHEEAEDAVAKYHNRLLDGKLMYVSLQQPTGYSTKSAKAAAAAQHSKSTIPKEHSSSAQASASKYAIDPAFMRQALFNPSNTSNAVQFQVKL